MYSLSTTLAFARTCDPTALPVHHFEQAILHSHVVFFWKRTILLNFSDFVFELILRSAWGLLSPGKRVGRSSTPCRKRSQIRGRKSGKGGHNRR